MFKISLPEPKVTVRNQKSLHLLSEMTKRSCAAKLEPNKGECWRLNDSIISGFNVNI